MNNFSTDLFEPYMGPQQMLLLKDRVNLGLMIMKE